MKEIKIDKIIRSSRRSVALAVTIEAKLVVRAPYRFTMEYIQNLVKSKSEWIERKQRQFVKKANDLKPKKFETGEEFYLLGKKFALEIVDGAKPQIWLDNNLKMTRACLKSPQKHINYWYIMQARQILEQRVELFALTVGFKFKSIRINSAKTRWGSCGPKNSLNFSWRLVAAPIVVIDSVIVHELVHTEIKNHSRLFYQRLRSIIPDYKEKEKWLKEYTGAFLL